MTIVSEIKVGDFFYWSVGFKDPQIYRCDKIYYNESEGQYLGEFTQMTDTNFSNSLGRKQHHNEIEMKNYLTKIHDIDRSLSEYEDHQKIK